MATVRLTCVEQCYYSSCTVQYYYYWTTAWVVSGKEARGLAVLDAAPLAGTAVLGGLSSAARLSESGSPVGGTLPDLRGASSSSARAGMPAAEALEVVGQLSRLVDASLARAPLDLATSDEEDAPRLRIGAVVSTKWGPAVVEARRPAADPAHPRRVVCRTFWRARVLKFGALSRARGAPVVSCFDSNERFTLWIER